MTVRIAEAELAHDAPGLSRHGCVVVIADETGMRGRGEASPLPGFSADTWNEARRALVAAVRQLAGVEIGDDEGAAAGVGRALAPLRGTLVKSSSARFAVEAAVLDLLARRRGQALHATLGARDVAPLGVAALLRLDGRDAGEIVGEARRVRDAGLTTLKVKTSAREEAVFERDLESLAAIHRALPELRLRVDPNGAWTVEQARRRLAQLAKLDVEYVEQPVPSRELHVLGKTDAPWAADESLRIPGEAERLLEQGACSVFVLKPQLDGGVLAARDLARRAADRGVESVVTHAFEGAVGLATCAELALLLGPRRACGLDPAYLPPDVAVPAQLARRGSLVPIERPGHGVDEP